MSMYQLRINKDHAESHGVIIRDVGDEVLVEFETVAGPVLHPDIKDTIDPEEHDLLSEMVCRKLAGFRLASLLR